MTIIISFFCVFLADIITQVITGKNSEQVKKDDKAKDLSLNLTLAIFLSIITFGYFYVMLNPQQFEKSSYQKYQECMEEDKRERGKHMYSGGIYAKECDQYK
ncbi:hypothetical protein [Calothrix sp. NIES-2100]|uniref:hypothetical protein n=1 Tax=Calothrix sp. NIES-2100 TaxID=1954172 RepID=UPI000BBCD119